MWDVSSGEVNSSQWGDEISEFSVGLSKLIEVVAEMKERESKIKTIEALFQIKKEYFICLSSETT